MCINLSFDGQAGRTSDETLRNNTKQAKELVKIALTTDYQARAKKDTKGQALPLRVLAQAEGFVMDDLTRKAALALAAKDVNDAGTAFLMRAFKR